jgi:hypothetical protein
MKKVLKQVTLGGSLALLLLVSCASAQDSPTVTIQNQSAEPVLAKLAGPSAGSVSIPAGGSRTVQVSGGRYLALFRYGERRYSYTKVGPFDVVQTPTEVSVITIVLHTYAGNTNEQPSDEREFDGQ